ncbi:TPA: hypothetical protein DEP86_02490, partial [Candidatus Uhrbacteria bacterium]|nr:hypothetical protein [Candidatus Uhrbacteria bacterium]
MSFALLVVVALSAFFSGRPDSYIPTAWLLLGYLLTWSIFAFFKLSIRLVAIALSIGGALQFMLALSQFSFQRVIANKWLGIAEHLPDIAGTSVVETINGRWLRAYGSLPHPNMLGTYLAIAALASLFLFLSVRGRWRLLAGLGAMVNILGMGLTFSRSAFVGFLAGLVVLLAGYALVTKRSDRRSVLLVAGFSLTILIAVSALLYEPFLTRIMAIGRLERISIESRLNQYDEAWGLVKMSPWFGVGPGMMPEVSAYVLAMYPNPWDYQPIHNLPILILVETGIVGLIVWLALVLSLLRLGIKTVFRRTGFDSVLPVVLLIVLLTAGLFDHFVWSS